MKTEYHSVVTSAEIEDTGRYLISNVESGKFVVVTDHASRRLKERSGLSKKAGCRMALKAYEEGIMLYELNGYKKQWAKLKLRNSNYDEDIIYKVYGKMLYIFDDNTLITVEHLPGRERIMRMARGERTAFESDRKRTISLEKRKTDSIFAA